MRYIVFDLEWNQCPSGKSDEVAELPFEIFEIGAVKLDDNMQRIGSFSCYIKPKVYKELHYIAKGLTHVTEELLEDGRDFGDAVRVSWLVQCGRRVQNVYLGNLGSCGVTAQHEVFRHRKFT